MARIGYRLTMLPLRIADGLIVPVLFDADRPVRLAFERLLIDCDRLAAGLLDDESAAAHAADLSARTTPVRYALAREQLRTRAAADATLARHRALFLQRQRAHRRDHRP
ncbi:hypothetical protein ACFYVR_18785 [Rhodococcus sp. NPDC003318]|uniref:hypothetical protein n=1 Tax=Rhodococcus sp. NPDC003318 TaxID=3364503 RepID=UPI0036AF744A